MKRDTIIIHAGRDPRAHQGVINTPIYRASTVLYAGLDALEHATRHREYGRTYYGLGGTPTTFAFEEAVAKLEGGFRCRAVGSGLAAITAPLLGFLQAGDHLLMVDSCYGPSRRFCDGMLKRLGVETTYYDPLAGAAIAGLIRPNTRALFMEAPGSHTFEMQDIPALVAAAKARDLVTMIDNTWASPLFLRPIEFGVDVSIQAATKYIAGHSDVIMGTVTTSEAAWEKLNAAVRDLGFFASPDDCYLALRGLRTIHVRLPRHQESGLRIARWLQARPEVERVLHPALPEDPGHALWKRDFRGACGLFGVVFRPAPRAAFAAMIDNYRLFGMGASWGGFESLVMPTFVTRTATRWEPAGPVARYHIGLEDPDDLIADLEAGFERLRATSPASSETE
jgi:cystathionine beta-lyase